ncbi:MAG: hypothetical protein AAF456_16765 [Planctomycetota bacterium]
MRRLLAVAVAAVAISFLTTDLASAQVGSGYRFGVGVNYGSFPYPGTRANGRNLHNGGAFFGGFRPTPRVEEPPYFAKFPPVYYNGIVSRPYGVSPYAAPPGIVPVEMSAPVAVPPVTIRNPYFNNEIETVADDLPEVNEDESSNQTTHVVNPYLDTITINE